MTDDKRLKFEFIGKYIIQADIKLKTALHVGGTEEGFDIGGIDNPVIKDKVTGVPYIPGSSLKGKMRSLLEWAYNKVAIVEVKEKDDGNEKTVGWKGTLCVNPNEPIGIIFGIPAEEHQKSILAGPTRLTVRDAYPDKNQVKDWETCLGEKIYTEAKIENTIDRLTSAATPRTLERVPAGSIFKAEFIYDVYKPEDRENLKILFEGMELLQDSYLGGGGTRGSGQVEFQITYIEARDKNYYVGSNQPIKLVPTQQNDHKTPKAIKDSFCNIFPAIPPAEQSCKNM